MFWLPLIMWAVSTGLKYGLKDKGGEGEGGGEASGGGGGGLPGLGGGGGMGLPGLGGGQQQAQAQQPSYAEMFQQALLSQMSQGGSQAPQQQSSYLSGDYVPSISDQMYGSQPQSLDERIRSSMRGWR